MRCYSHYIYRDFFVSFLSIELHVQSQSQHVKIVFLWIYVRPAQATQIEINMIDGIWDGDADPTDARKLKI